MIKDRTVGRDLRTVIAVLLCLLGAALAVFFYSLTLGGDKQTAWFTGLGVIVAVVALVFAGFAAIFTYPAYRDWQREHTPPPVHISIEAALETRLPDLTEITGDSFSTATRADEKPRLMGPAQPVYNVFVRVAVHNDGRTAVRWGALNVLVEWGKLALGPNDVGTNIHPVPGPVKDKDIHPGQVVLGQAVIATSDFPPGIRMFHVICYNCPPGEDFVLVARVEGEPLPEPVVRRVRLRVDPPPQT